MSELSELDVMRVIKPMQLILLDGYTETQNCFDASDQLLVFIECVQPDNDLSIGLADHVLKDVIGEKFPGSLSELRAFVNATPKDALPLVIGWPEEGRLGWTRKSHAWFKRAIAKAKEKGLLDRQMGLLPDKAQWRREAASRSALPLRPEDLPNDFDLFDIDDSI
jgi:hypothetical protein